VTIWTCKYLGIYELIDFFGTSEVYSAKPNDEMLLQFCREMDLTPDQVIHVGDSVADMEFALHCRAGVGVLSGIGTEQELIHHTEHIIPSIKELVPLLDATFY
jgi:phosphoglycolate phosphatase